MSPTHLKSQFIEHILQTETLLGFRILRQRKFRPEAWLSIQWGFKRLPDQREQEKRSFFSNPSSSLPLLLRVFVSCIFARVLYRLVSALLLRFFRPPLSLCRIAARFLGRRPEYERKKEELTTQRRRRRRRRRRAGQKKRDPNSALKKKSSRIAKIIGKEYKKTAGSKTWLSIQQTPFFVQCLFCFIGTWRISSVLLDYPRGLWLAKRAIFQPARQAPEGPRDLMTFFMARETKHKNLNLADEARQPSPEPEQLLSINGQDSRTSSTKIKPPRNSPYNTTWIFSFPKQASFERKHYLSSQPTVQFAGTRGEREKFFGPQSNYTRLSTGVRGTRLTRSPTHFFRNPVKVKEGTVLQGPRFSFARSVTRCMGPKMNSEHPRKYGGKMPHAGEDGEENKLSSLFSFPRLCPHTQEGNEKQRKRLEKTKPFHF